MISAMENQGAREFGHAHERLVLLLSVIPSISWLGLRGTPTARSHPQSCYGLTGRAGGTSPAFG
jgi:hypothetical protein